MKKERKIIPDCTGLECEGLNCESTKLKWEEDYVTLKIPLWVFRDSSKEECIERGMETFEALFLGYRGMEHSNNNKVSISYDNNKKTD